MKLSLRIRSGSMAGQCFEFTDGPVRIGRQPDLELSLNPEKDLSVSALHAELFRTDDGWSVRDLESRNGTLVDGRTIEEPTAVRTGSRITLGTGGPEMEVQLGDETTPGTMPSRPGVTAQIRSAVKRETRRLRTGLLLSCLALAALLAAFLIPGQLEESGSAAEPPAMDDTAMDDTAIADRSTAPSDGANTPSPPPQEDPSTSSSEAAPPPAATTTPQEDRPSSAQALNFSGIRDANGRAVAFVYVETAGGELLTGSAFAVRRDGLLLTVRHLVLPDPEGPPPARVAVQFANSAQVFPARLVATSTQEDLAALRVERLVGEVPVVGTLNTRPDTLEPGVPVATLGVHRTEAAASRGSADGGIVQPLLRAGILTSVDSARLEVHGYGEPGGSGSPVFDSAGQLVGVLYGGLEGGPNQVLLVVNPSRVARFLERIPN